MPMYRVKNSEGKTTELMGESAEQLKDLYSKMGEEIEVLEEVNNKIVPPIPAAIVSQGRQLFQESPRQPDVYFTEAGLNFKLSNGKLFKASWEDISEAEGEDYRVEFKDDSIDKSKVSLMKKVWVEIPSKPEIPQGPTPR